LTTKYCSEKVCHCTTKESDDFYVGVNQLFVDRQTHSLVSTDQLDVNHQCACETVDDQKTELHEIIVSGNHLFYVTTDDILVHNMIELPLKFIEFAGNQFFLNLPEQYEKLLCAGFLLAIESYNNIPQKLYIIEDTDKEKNLLLSKNDSNRNTQIYRFGAPEDKYCSMNEFFKNTKMGRDIKDRLSKAGIDVNGVEVYKVIKKIPEYNLKKGQYIYVDRKHCDHLELFDSQGDPLGVLNFNCSFNESKSKRTGGRKLCIK
jgi:filamentous hemagglutinin